MRLKSILILFLLAYTIFPANAQNRPQGRGNFDYEAIKREKATFLIQELNLTEAEAKAFIPLEAEFVTRKFEVNRDARRETRTLKRKEHKTDADYKRITQLNLESEKKETELQIEYFKKFYKVLPAEKVEKYRSADLMFKNKMLERHKDRHGNRRK
ncbi:MAG: hypothetical protein E6767_01010 [Dysgonomonas sp.]|nr:hypothetical protein [Dysgonomonas sp.]